MGRSPEKGAWTGLLTTPPGSASAVVEDGALVDVRSSLRPWPQKSVSNPIEEQKARENILILPPDAAISLPVKNDVRSGERGESYLSSGTAVETSILRMLAHFWDSGGISLATSPLPTGSQPGDCDRTFLVFGGRDLPDSFS